MDSLAVMRAYLLDTGKEARLALADIFEENGWLDVASLLRGKPIVAEPRQQEVPEEDFRQRKLAILERSRAKRLAQKQAAETSKAISEKLAQRLEAALSHLEGLPLVIQRNSNLRPLFGRFDTIWNGWEDHVVFDVRVACVKIMRMEIRPHSITVTDNIFDESPVLNLRGIAAFFERIVELHLDVEAEPPKQR